MNTVIAQGAPNSMTRYFQDNPEEGVALLRAVKAILECEKPLGTGLNDAEKVYKRIRRRIVHSLAA